MLKNTLQLVFRGLRKDIGFSAINLVGLAIGLASCLLILLYVTHEWSYDKQYDRAGDIHRIVIDADIGGDVSHFAIAPFAALPAFRDDLAAIEMGVRVQQFDGQVVVDNVNFEEEEIILADTAFFEVFSTRFISGDPTTVLDEPGSVVVTEETAERIFGKRDVVGENLTINGMEMTVSGVVENPSSPSHLEYDFLVSIMNLPVEGRTRRDTAWYNIGMQSYVMLAPGTDVAQLEAQIADTFEERAGATGRSVGIIFTFHLQPLLDIHLHSNLQAELSANGNISYVYAFSIIAIFILLIACINFANLSTARATMRAKEVGVRKAVGAQKGDLVGRFLTESFVTVLISMVLAVVLTITALGWMNNVTGKDLSLGSLVTPEMFGGAALLVLICAFLAGSYPAFVLSALKPVLVLRGQIGGVASKSLTRRALVVLQFSVSIILIIGTLAVKGQVDYMKNKSLGFDKEAVAVIQMDTANEADSWEALRQTLLGHSAIENASFASGVPGQTGELRLFVPEGSDSTETVAMTVARVDHDYVDTYGMRMADGRFFSRDFPADTSEAFVINQAAARTFGWTEGAIGKELRWLGVQDSRVIGVVEDYHFRALTEEIEPLVFYLSRRSYGLLTVRFAANAERSGLDFIQTEWGNFEAQRPLNITFVDDDLASRYGEQETVGTLVSTFTLLALFIAALGLFGLASLAVQQKTKEIGIRKALGARVGQLVLLVSYEFTSLLVIANVIAWPVAWYLIDSLWLSQFPYRTDLTVIPFAIAAVSSLVITFVATFYHSYTAARANPVNSLRYE